MVVQSSCPSRRGGIRVVEASAAPLGSVRRWALLACLALLLVGIVLSGGVHKAFHHEGEDGGGCPICHLTGFAPEIEPRPTLLRVLLASALPPRLEVPRERIIATGARPRAPPAA